MTERRPLGAGPQARPVGGNDQQAAAAGQNAPDFAQHLAAALRRFQPMHDHHPVEGQIVEGQAPFLGEGDQARAFLGPEHDALGGRHQRDGALRLTQKGSQIGRGVSKTEKRLAGQVRPE